MKITLEPMLALFNLGGGEIILMILVLLMLFATVCVVGLVVLLIVRSSGKRKDANSPASQPPAAQSTQVIRKCPKCGTFLKSDVPEGLCPACLLQRGIATEGGAPPGTPPFTPPPMLELAKLFPQLEILELIGQGGMGAVYKARQPALDRFVALKILAPRSGGDLDFSGRFTREARALARLSHPNIVAVYDFGQIQRKVGASSAAQPAIAESQALSYFIMEYVDGPNLRQVEQSGKLTPREALQIIPQICAALQFAHDEGIVHRDIKPENVLLDKKGRVKIADFGLAKILGQEADFRLTGARDVMGTPHYMAPEQVEKPQEVDHRADIYSLGVVFYEMLTGELPLGKFDPPSHKVQIDVRLDNVVLRSLANNPDRRYQHVSEVKTEVESIAETPSAATKSSAPVAASPPNRSLATGLGIAIGVFAAVVCIAVLGLLAAVAIPNFIKARHRAQEMQNNRLLQEEAALPVVEREVNKPVGDFPQTPDFSTPEGAYAAWARAAARRDAEALNQMELNPSGPKRFTDWFQREQERDSVGTTVYQQAKILSVQIWRGNLANVIAEVPHPASAHLGHYNASVWFQTNGAWKYFSDQLCPDAAGAKKDFANNKENVWQLITAPPASAETWSPTLAPGEKPDLQKILEDAKDLMKRGQYEESLGRFIWYYNHEPEYGDSYQNAIRSTSAISDWVELGRRYPKAKQALIEIRDRQVRQFTEGRGYADLFQNIQAINHELQDDNATYALFKAMRKGDPQLARQCYFYVESLLVSKGEYQWCFDNMGDPQARFDQAKQSLEMQIGFQKQMAASVERSHRQIADMYRQRGMTNGPAPVATDPSDVLGRSATNGFVGTVNTLVEILVGTAHLATAEKIRDEALAVMDDPRLKSAVSDAEARIQKRSQSSENESSSASPSLERTSASSKLPNLTIPSPAALAAGITNTDDAARETWAPALGPDEKPDLMKISQEANDLMSQGRYEESLQRQIWYHNHSLSDPSQTGVRNSFALSGWVELGRRYPKAMRALVEIRNKDEQKFSAGEGFFDLFMEVDAINRELGADDRTYALFKGLAASSDQKLAQQCYSIAEGAIAARGDYELCMKYIGDPEERFKGIQAQWQRIKQWEQHQDDMQRQMNERLEAARKQFNTNSVVTPSFAPPLLHEPPKVADKNFVAQTRQLIEILVGAGRKSDAEKIRGEAAALLDDSRIKSAVDDAVEKTGTGVASEASPSVTDFSPVVVETQPVSGARDVAPGETEIRVRFSKAMENGSWSWSTAWENSTPESLGPPAYLEDGRTCVMKVRLEPARTYGWWLNSEKFSNFKDSFGRPAVPYLLIFQTKPN